MNATYGLIFDVDGVIADTESVNAEATAAVLEELSGIEGARREDFEQGLGRGAEEYVRAGARARGRELRDDEVREAVRLRQERFLALLAARPLPPFPGVVKLLGAALEREDFRVAIATSSAREKSEAVLRSAKIPYERTAYITGSDVRRKKPDPELFLLAASRISLPPERCAVIEDAPDGVRAARRAGCRTIAVTNSVAAEKLSEADAVVGSLEEVDLERVVRLIEGGGGR